MRALPRWPPCVLLASVLWALAAAGSAHAAGPSQARAPTGPPLVSGPSAYVSPGEGAAEAQEETEPPPTNSEPLVQNGLGSPLCRDALTQLPSRAQGNCEASQFVASEVPASHYELDVNIDTGLTFRGDIDSAFQDWLIKRPWSVLVWAVHAVLVAIEWSYALDLLSSPAMGAVAKALAGAERAFTQPWLAAVLAVAAVLVAYRGIVKRRVAQSLGEALALLAMIACGLWMIADPLGTIGMLAERSDAASIQTLAAVSGGTPAHPDATLASSANALFSVAIGEPWCYLEFGNVRWCEDPRALDPRLRAAALHIAGSLESKARAAGARITGSGPGAEWLRAAQLLRAAQTNGAVFLALPANGELRNSSKDPNSLLSAICSGPNDTHCEGPTAAEAEFRADVSTSSRAVGFVLIALGLVGLLLLLGFIVGRLLGAALLALVLLLAAPVIVLAPALGDGGRGLFRRWATRLLAAVAAKLIWSCLLGVLLIASEVLIALGGLGWWVRWLLFAVLWWGAFLNRHRLLAPSSHSAPGPGRVLSSMSTRPARLARQWLGRRWSGRQRDGSGWRDEQSTTLRMPRSPEDASAGDDPPSQSEGAGGVGGTPPRGPSSPSGEGGDAGDRQPPGSAAADLGSIGEQAQARQGGDSSSVMRAPRDGGDGEAQGGREREVERSDRSGAEHGGSERSESYFADVVQRLRTKGADGAPTLGASPSSRPERGRSAAADAPERSAESRIARGGDGDSLGVSAAGDAPVSRSRESSARSSASTSRRAPEMLAEHQRRGEVADSQAAGEHTGGAPTLSEQWEESGREQREARASEQREAGASDRQKSRESADERRRRQLLSEEG